MESKKIKKRSVIKFEAHVQQGKSAISGVLFITLSLQPKNMKQFLRLLETKGRGEALEISAMPFIDPEESNAKKEKVNPGRKTRRRLRYPHYD